MRFNEALRSIKSEREQDRLAMAIVGKPYAQTSGSDRFVIKYLAHKHLNVTPSSGAASSPAPAVQVQPLPEPVQSGAEVAPTPSVAPAPTPQTQEQLVRRVTGSTPIPLNEDGHAQAKALAAKMRRPFTKVISSPQDRAVETASYFGTPETNDAFDAAHRGALEGQPVDQAKDQIGDLLENPDKSAPGVSPTSGEPGESQTGFESKLFTGVQNIMKEVKPGDRILVVTHGGDLQAIDAWAKAGFPNDFKFDRSKVSKQPYWSATGQLFRLESDGLRKVDGNKKSGVYFIEHGNTDYNPKNEESGTESDSTKEVVQEREDAQAESTANGEENAPSEAADTPRKFAYTGLNLPTQISDLILKWASKIPEKSLAEAGREITPHVTLLADITEDDIKPVEEVAKARSPVKINLESRMSLFQNPDADVLKIDVESPELVALHDDISDSTENDPQHADYKPHVTIAYLLPGEGRRYVRHPLPGVTGKEMTLGVMTFSTSEGEKTNIPLTGPPSKPKQDSTYLNTILGGSSNG